MKFKWNISHINDNISYRFPIYASNPFSIDNKIKINAFIDTGAQYNYISTNIKDSLYLSSDSFQEYTTSIGGSIINGKRI